jgi:hypothetical protein
LVDPALAIVRLPCGESKLLFLSILNQGVEVVRVVALCGGILGLVGAIVLWSLMSTNNPVAEWKMSNDGKSVSIENGEATKIEMPTRTIIYCNAAQPGVQVTIYNYHGNALVSVDESKRPLASNDLRRPLIFIVKNLGVSREFQTSAHYVASEIAWALDPPLPVDFLDVLAQGDTLLIQNRYRQIVAEFTTHGIQQAHEVMRGNCRS